MTRLPTVFGKMKNKLQDVCSEDWRSSDKRLADFFRWSNHPKLAAFQASFEPCSSKDTCKDVSYLDCSPLGLSPGTKRHVANRNSPTEDGRAKAFCI